MRFAPPCRVCGTAAATIALDPLSPPDGACTHRLRYSGPGGSSGSGRAIVAAEVDRIVAAFTGPTSGERIRALGWYDNAGFCMQCGAFYCATHWSISSTGYGTCPRGHGKSLDPHWSPDD